LAAVDEIAAENDDRYETGDGPVRATVGSEPSAQQLLAMINDGRGAHVRSSCFVATMENKLGFKLFQVEENRRLVSLIYSELVRLRIRQYEIAIGSPALESFFTILRVSNFAQSSLWQRASLLLKIRPLDIGATVGALGLLPIARIIGSGGEFREAGR
jgi:hypothetical protein